MRTTTGASATAVTVNLGLRYEYYGPQTKSDPKFDSNFYYGDPNVSVNTSSPADIVRGIATGAPLPTNESPIGALWKSDWNNWAPRLGFAWDVTGDGRTSVRGGYGMSYERNFGNVTYNVLFNPPKYLVASIDAPASTSRRCRSSLTTPVRSAASPASPRRFPAAACATSIRTSRRPTRTSMACRCRSRSVRR